MSDHGHAHREYLIDSDYLIFTTVMKSATNQMLLRLSILIFAILGSDVGGVFSIFSPLLALSKIIAYATPLIERIALVRPRPDVTRAILSAIVLMTPFEIIRSVRNLRRAGECAINKRLLMIKLCNDKSTLLGCVFFAIYRLVFITVGFAGFVAMIMFELIGEHHLNAVFVLYKAVAKTSIGLEFVIGALVVIVIQSFSIAVVAVPYLLRERFNPPNGGK